MCGIARQGSVHCHSKMWKQKLSMQHSEVGLTPCMQDVCASPEVCDLAHEAANVSGRALEEHIGGLEIAVQHADAVQVRHAAGDVNQAQQH